jgi:Protein of unknown function (DUF3667)
MDELEKPAPPPEEITESQKSSEKNSSNEEITEPEKTSEKISVNEFCLNCGTKLQDQFCHHCGQKDIPQRQTLGELWTNFISSFWSYEGKFFQTTKLIITKPGFLAVEYNKGKRESYYHPARMYVFISFVFFLLFFSLPDANDNIDPDFNIKGDSINRTTLIPNADSTEIAVNKTKAKNNFRFRLSDIEFKTVKEYDSLQQAKHESERDGLIWRTLRLKAIELNQRYGNAPEKFNEDVEQLFYNNFSKVLFWLLPIFAILLKLLYVRKDFFFSEHLVFSIYYYNFFYFAGSVLMLVNLVSWLGWLAVAIGLWIFFYLLFAMKRMYSETWGKTILKFAAFTLLFSLMLALGLTINMFSILFLI